MSEDQNEDKNKDKKIGRQRAAGAKKNGGRGAGSGKAKAPMSHEPPKVNREYKDRLFKFLFASHPELTLSLYNAINGTDHKKVDELEITTANSALFISLRNDLSFLIADTMNFYEAQSTPNPNMPARFFFYVALVYINYIQRSGIDLSRRKLQKLPTPRLVCFYEGRDDPKIEDEKVLTLDAAFNNRFKSNVSVEVTLLNINQGHNRELLEKCRPLNDYSKFIFDTRNYYDSQKKDKMTDEEHDRLLAEAVEAAIDNLPDGQVKTYLKDEVKKVTDMCVFDFNLERSLNNSFEDGKEEGRAEGRAEGVVIGEARGEVKGRADGLDMFADLLQKLNKAGRAQEAAQVITDKALRDRLLEEFGISGPSAPQS